MDGGDDMKTTSPAKLTYEDFLRFPDDGLRHELIDGEHHVTPSPNTAHQRLVGDLHVALRECLGRTNAGEVFLAPFDVVLSNHDVVEPDLLVVMSEQASILTTQHVRGAPGIVIEVVSPGTIRRDEGVKWRLYDRVGVLEYWLVDPDRAAVTVWRRAAAEDVWAPEELTASRGDVLTSPLLAGLALALPQLFRQR